MESNEIRGGSKYGDNSKEIIKNIESIIGEYKTLKTYIELNIINSVNNFDEIIKNSTKDYKSNKSKESNINQFKDLINIYENKHIIKINKLIEDLKNMVDNMIDEFNPSNINDSSNKLNEFKLESNKNNQNDENEDNICKKFYQEYSEFCDDKNINGGINENSSTKGISCNYCKNGKAVYYDHNIYACEDCVKKIINHEGETNHNFNKMDEKKKNKKYKKMNF